MLKSPRASALAVPALLGRGDTSWNTSSFLGKVLHPPTSPLAPTQQELSLKKGLGAEETKASLYHLPSPPGTVRSR